MYAMSHNPCICELWVCAAKEICRKSVHYRKWLDCHRKVSCSVESCEFFCSWLQNEERVQFEFIASFIGRQKSLPAPFVPSSLPLLEGRTHLIRRSLITCEYLVVTHWKVKADLSSVNCFAIWFLCLLISNAPWNLECLIDWAYISFLKFIFIFIVLRECMSVCMRVSEALELELQAGVSCQGGAGNWARILWKNSQCS